MLYERLGFQIMVSDDGTARKRKRLYSHRRIDLNLRHGAMVLWYHDMMIPFGIITHNNGSEV